MYSIFKHSIHPPANHHTDYTTLNNDVWLTVLQYCDVNDISAMSLTNHYFSRLCNNNVLWYHLYTQYTNNYAQSMDHNTRYKQQFIPIQQYISYYNKQHSVKQVLSATGMVASGLLLVAGCYLLYNITQQYIYITHAGHQLVDVVSTSIKPLIESSSTGSTVTYLPIIKYKLHNSIDHTIHNTTYAISHINDDYDTLSSARQFISQFKPNTIYDAYQYISPPNNQLMVWLVQYIKFHPYGGSILCTHMMYFIIVAWRTSKIRSHTTSYQHKHAVRLHYYTNNNHDDSGNDNDDYINHETGNQQLHCVWAIPLVDNRTVSYSVRKKLYSLLLCYITVFGVLPSIHYIYGILYITKQHMNTINLLACSTVLGTLLHTLYLLRNSIILDRVLNDIQIYKSDSTIFTMDSIHIIYIVLSSKQNITILNYSVSIVCRERFIAAIDFNAQQGTSERVSERIVYSDTQRYNNHIQLNLNNNRSHIFPSQHSIPQSGNGIYSSSIDFTDYPQFVWSVQVNVNIKDQPADSKEVVVQVVDSLIH